MENLAFPNDYKDKVIWEVRAPHGELIKIYDTDRRVVLGRVKDDYRMDKDLIFSTRKIRIKETPRSLTTYTRLMKGSQSFTG